MTMLAGRRNRAIIGTLLEKASDTERTQILTQLYEHVQAEFCGDLEALMATLVADPRFDHRTGATVGRTITAWPCAIDGRNLGKDIDLMTSNVSDAIELQLNPYLYGEDS